MSKESFVRDGLEQEKLLYPVSKVAEMFSVSKKSIHRLLQRGLLQSSGAFRHRMITRASIEKFMSNVTWRASLVAAVFYLLPRAGQSLILALTSLGA